MEDSFLKGVSQVKASTGYSCRFSTTPRGSEILRIGCRSIDNYGKGGIALQERSRFLEKPKRTSTLASDRLMPEREK